MPQGAAAGATTQKTSTLSPSEFRFLFFPSYFPRFNQGIHYVCCRRALPRLVVPAQEMSSSGGVSPVHGTALPPNRLMRHSTSDMRHSATGNSNDDCRLATARSLAPTVPSLPPSLPSSRQVRAPPAEQSRCHANCRVSKAPHTTDCATSAFILYMHAVRMGMLAYARMLCPVNGPHQCLASVRHSKVTSRHVMARYTRYSTRIM